MKPAAALFDFDGTLVDTEGPDCALISRMLLEVGIRKTPNEVMKDFIGLPRTEIEEAILAHYGVQVPLDWHPRYIEERSKLEDRNHQRRQMETAFLGQPLEDALRRLQNSGVQLGVASNSYEPRLKRVLAKSGLETWFGDRLFHLDQGSRRKPAPDIYLFALRSLGISPEEAVAVEDSPLGVQAAVAAGIRCIGFTGHNHVGEAIDQELLQAGAFVLEPDMGKVADLILKG